MGGKCTLFHFTQKRRKMDGSFIKEISICLVVEGLAGGIPKGHEEIWEMMDTFTILTVVMISQVCAYVRSYQILHFKHVPFRDFPGGPGAKTQRSQCRGAGFNPWSSGTRSHMPQLKISHATRSHLLQLRPGTAK